MIARKLAISEGKVKNLLNKLALGSCSEAAAWLNGELWRLSRM